MPSSRRSEVRSVLVAGGAGFLGSHLCERLVAEGRRVYCLDSLHTGVIENLRTLEREARFQFIEGDVRRPRIPPVDQIFNLASPASPLHYQRDPIYTLTTNVGGTAALLQAAEEVGARYLQASTSEVYGDPQEHPQRESYNGNVNPTGPRACYDEGKRAAEALCFDFLRHSRVDVRVARIFNTYGPRMRADDGRIVCNLIAQALRGEPLTIHGDGTQTRSFCYVSDLIEGLIRLMQFPQVPKSAVNLGNPDEFSILELAGEVVRLVGYQGCYLHHPLPQDDPRRRRPDISLALRLLKWQPQVTLRDGLPPTVAWFRHSPPATPATSAQPAAVGGV